MGLSSAAKKALAKELGVSDSEIWNLDSFGAKVKIEHITLDLKSKTNLNSNQNNFSTSVNIKQSKHAS